MTQLPESEGGQAVAKRGLTSLDLLVVARDLRYQWFAFAFARLSARVARLGASHPATAPNASSTGKVRVFSDPRRNPSIGRRTILKRVRPAVPPRRSR